MFELCVNLFEYFFLFYILFWNVISKYFDIPLFSYLDEAFFLLVAIYYVLCKIGSKFSVNEVKNITLVFVIIIIGLSGNLIWSFQSSYSAIMRDLVNFLKFPLSLIIFFRLPLSKNLQKDIVKISSFLRLFCFIIFLLGIISLFKDLGMSQNEIRHGIHPYMFIFSHPTYLTSFLISSLLLLGCVDKLTTWDELFILITIGLGMRTKGFVFISVYIFIKYFSNVMRKFKVIYWIGVIVIIIFASYQKLGIYYSYSSSMREVLYLGSLDLLKKCFPIGSGFATFASHISWESKTSHVYEIIRIPSYYIVNGLVGYDIGDAGYAYYISQFGFLGILIFFFLMIRLLKQSFKENSYDLVIMYWIYIMTTLFTESILIDNGFQYAVILSILCVKNPNLKMNKKSVEIKKNSNNIT